MKIAIISDIHGNWSALQAVVADLQQWQPDQIIVNGDSISRGPSSLACWEFVRQQRWVHTLGNHESYVWEHQRNLENEGAPAGHSGVQAQLNAPSLWTWHRLRESAYFSEINSRPFFHIAPQTPPGLGKVICYHGTVESNKRGIYPGMTDKMIQQQISASERETGQTAVLCTAHIHTPFVRQVGETWVVNSGAVGQPCDGDTRASYARLMWKNGRWQATIARVSYDRVAADRAFRETGFLADNAPISWLMYLEWRFSLYAVTPWRQQYQELVMAGELALETAVEQYLHAAHLPHPDTLPLLS